MHRESPFVAFGGICKVNFVPEIANAPNVLQLKLLPADIYLLFFLSPIEQGYRRRTIRQRLCPDFHPSLLKNGWPRFPMASWSTAITSLFNKISR